MDFITFLNYQSPEIVLEAAGDGYLDPIQIDKDPLKIRRISASEKKAAREYIDQLSPTNASSLAHYTSSGYESQNRSMRKDDSKTSVTNNIIKKYKCSEDMWVFRGWGGKLDVQKLKKGDRYSLKGITSTTQDSSIAINFSSFKSVVPNKNNVHRFINKIFIPKGSPALDLSSISYHKSEKEIVLPHNSIIEVTDHEVYVTGSKHQYHIVNFKLVS